MQMKIFHFGKLSFESKFGYKNWTKTTKFSDNGHGQNPDRIITRKLELGCEKATDKIRIATGGSENTLGEGMESLNGKNTHRNFWKIGRYFVQVIRESGIYHCYKI